MADFKAAYKIVMKNEGGYANNPNDRGGETWKGIARKIHPKWPGWEEIDALKKKSNWMALLKQSNAIQMLVELFYEDNFWDEMLLGLINNQRIAEECFDTAVNMGTGRAALFLQRALNVTNKSGKEYPDLKLDAQIGEKTIATINGHKRPKDVLKVLNCLQGAKYIEICEANPSQEEFMSGWLTRVFENNPL